MKELNLKQTEQVSGGIVPIIIGAAIAVDLMLIGVMWGMKNVMEDNAD